MQTVLVLLGLACASGAGERDDQEALANIFLALSSGSRVASARLPARHQPRMALDERVEVSVPVVNFEGAQTGEKPMALKIAESGPYIIQRKVVQEAANARGGTAHVKTRSEVRGGGRKPYQQKGTGRARRGSSRSPLLVGGGKTFGPRNERNYHLDMNKKERKLALSTAFMNAGNRMVVVPDLESNFNAPKTKTATDFLKRLGLETDDQVYVLVKSNNENAWLSWRNIPTATYSNIDKELSIIEILKAKKLILSEEAFNEISERYNFEGGLQRLKKEDAEAAVEAREKVLSR